MLTDEQVKAAFDSAKARVKVLCDEAHTHTANDSCLGGSEDAVNVCRLAESLLSERRHMRAVVATFEPDDLDRDAEIDSLREQVADWASRFNQAAAKPLALTPQQPSNESGGE